MKIGTMERKMRSKKMLKKLEAMDLSCDVKDVLRRFIKDQYLLTLDDIKHAKHAVTLVCLSLLNIEGTAMNVLKNIDAMKHTTIGMEFHREDGMVHYIITVQGRTPMVLTERINAIIETLREVAGTDLNATLRMLKFSFDKTK